VAHTVAIGSAARPSPRPASSSGECNGTGISSRVGITFYGSEQHEADLLREIAARLDVTPTITSAAASEATAGLSGGNRCISIGHKSQISRATLLALHRAGVRYISTRSAGYNHIDLHAAEHLGIAVENVVYSPASVADYTLMLMLMVVRDAKSTVLRSQAHDYRLSGVPGRELRDMTIGVVGAGRIGVEVIKRLRSFGSRVLVSDRRPHSDPSLDCLSITALLAQSDVVTLHTPLTAETHHLLDRQRISQMKPGAFVINTGRGALLDTEGLLHALESGRLGGAALDVLEDEEGTFYFDHSRNAELHPSLVRLHQLPNVLITPHSAYYTDHALRDIVETTLTNCLDFLRKGRHG
jgi:D-specific alpha-keto acid dehydrogenase